MPSKGDFRRVVGELKKAEAEVGQQGQELIEVDVDLMEAVAGRAEEAAMRKAKVFMVGGMGVELCRLIGIWVAKNNKEKLLLLFVTLSSLQCHDSALVWREE